MIRIIRTQAGFSLIQVLVSAGIMILLAVGISQTLSQGWKNTGRMSSKVSANGLAQELQTVLANRTQCSKVMEGITVRTGDNAQTNVELNLPNGLSGLKRNADLKTQGISIRELYLDGMTKAGSTEDGNSIYKANLQLEAATYVAPGASEEEKNRAMLFKKVQAGTMLLELNSANQVLSCVDPEGLGGSPEVSCKGLGGIWKNDQCNFPSEYECHKYNGKWDPVTKQCDFTKSPKAVCEEIGGDWSGGECSFFSKDQCRQLDGKWDPVTKKCDLSQSAKKACEQLGGNWDGKTCNLTNPKDNCLKMGGDWKGGQCQFSNAQSTCKDLGGNWKSGKCQMMSREEACEFIGGKWKKGECLTIPKREINYGVCPKGSYLAGYDVDGDRICREDKKGGGDSKSCSPRTGERCGQACSSGFIKCDGSCSVGFESCEGGD